MSDLMNMKTLRLCFIACFCLGLSFTSVKAQPPTDSDYAKGLATYNTGDIVGAMPFLKRAADAGHAAAQALYGSILDSAELDGEAASYLKKSASQGNPEGMHALAKMYMTGEAQPNDPGEAHQLLRAAAAQGHQRAIIVLANAYLRRERAFEIEDHSDPRVAEVIIKAAELGDRVSIEALYRAYSEGGVFGLEIDSAKANYWAEILGRSAQKVKSKGNKK